MVHYSNDDSSKKIPSKHNKILIFISANTKKDIKEVRSDFLQIYKTFNQRNPQRYRKSFVLLHQKYIREREE